MNRRKLLVLLSVVTTTLAEFLGFQRKAQAGQGMMSGNEMGGMMAPDNMKGPMRLGMELFERHREIRRATQYLPNGIVDTTVSPDPATAGIIKAHVVEMYQRLYEDRPFPYPMSPSVTAMFANSTKYKRSYRLLPTGIEVTETSDDPEMVRVIYAHAKELDHFAKEGMPAMMRGMMQSAD